MDVDEQPPPESVAEMQGVGDLPMETEQTEQTGVSLGSFQPELGMPGYNQSLVGSTDQPPSPMMAEENALLDVDPDALGLNQSKAPGAGRLDGSPGSKMVLRKRKTWTKEFRWEVKKPGYTTQDRSTRMFLFF